MKTESIERVLATDGDGTIFDTHENILQSTIYAVGEVLGKVITEEDIHPHFGAPIRSYYALLGALEHQIELCLEAHGTYQNAHFDQVVAFDGAVEALWRLKREGVPSYLVTSRGGNSLDVLLKRTGAGEVLDAVVDAHEVDVHKPDPLPFMVGLSKIEQRLGITTPGKVFVFGDTGPDIEGGKNLQRVLPEIAVLTIGALYGQKKMRLMDDRPHFSVMNVTEMPEIVLGN